MGLIGILFAALFNVLFFAGFVVLWRRTKRNKDDEMRWSRSFQLLETKIAVFEDLSDRTEAQVKSLTQMMEQKVEELQKKIEEADRVLSQISQSMEKSMEVAQIFQEQIPHEEIIERQNTVKFVKAALMAHEGHTAKDIAGTVDLPKAQIDFIVKVNSERLSFDPSQMPDWLKMEINRDPKTKHFLFERQKIAVENWNKAAPTKATTRPLNQILKERSFLFENRDIEESSSVEEKVPQISPVSSQNVLKIRGQDKGPASTSNTDEKVKSFEPDSLGKRAKDLGIRPVIFPKIEI